MKKGDRAFFYHTGEERRIAGIVEIVRESYPIRPMQRASPVRSTSKRVEPMPKPVTLAAIKAEKKLKDMALVKYSRLSVQPVTPEEWKIVCRWAA